MNTYQCVLTYNRFVTQNFFRTGKSAKEVLKELQSFDYGKGTWKIYLDDDLQITGSA